MRVFKSDGRYKHHNLGLVYICEFMWNSERELFKKLITAFAEMYGPPTDRIATANGFNIRKYNEHYRFEMNTKAKRRRIYIREEHYITMVMLTLGH